MHRGYIPLYRKFIEWEWYTDNNVKCLYIHLLIKANHKPKKWQGVLIGKGQVLTGRKSLSVETGLSEMQVRTALKKLEKTKNITSKVTSKYTIITVCNFNDYMLNNQQNNQQVTSKVTSEQPTDNQQVTTTKNDKELKELKKSNKAKFEPDLSELQLDKVFLIKEWFEYKKERKEMYKAQTGVTKLINEMNLNNINDIQNAIDLAIKNQYKGFFINKDNNLFNQNNNSRCGEALNEGKRSGI